MAKKTYKIVRFDGGINNDSDPRDIGDNQFATLGNVSIDRVGKITMLGDLNGQKISLAGAIDAAGTGLFTFKTDYTGFATGSVDTSGQSYYIIEGAAKATVISSDGSSESATDISVTGLVQALFYYVNGGLRIIERSHTTTIDNKVRMIRPVAKTYGVASSNTDATLAAGWFTNNADVNPCFPTLNQGGVDICKNAHVVNTEDGNGTDVIGYGFNGETNVNGGDADGGVWDGTAHSSTCDSNEHWGLALEINEESNDSGGWMPETTTTYQFYVTTMIDDHTQESLPQTMYYHTTKMLKGSSSTGSVGSADGYLSQVAPTEFTFSDGYSITLGQNVAVKFRPVLKLNNLSTTDFNFGAGPPDATSGGYGRQSGVRIYFSSSEDGNATLWQLCDIHFEKGIKMIGAGGMDTSGYTPFVITNGPKGSTSADYLTLTGHETYAKGITYEQPPRYLRYDVLNMHGHTEIVKIDSCKTAVVANNRVYIGNVKQDGIIYADRMMKSGVNQFDKFPSVSNVIDVATHDGDEIILLLEYADRILQFKKNICYIINISGNSEYLESEHKYKGISNPGAACKTDYGIAWANNNGCYLYDGRGVVDLLQQGGIRMIGSDIWNTHISTTNHHRVGFIPSTRQIVVKCGSSHTYAYLYDLTTKSWTYNATMVTDADSNANFINDPDDGNLLCWDAAGSIDKWQIGGYTGQADSTLNIVTKDIDFGDASIRKKVYKVYITYKVNDATVPSVYYDTDGNTTLTNQADATGTSAFTNTSGQWARADYRFDSDANNCYSIQLKINGPTDKSFEINDITFLYRLKSIK